MADNRLPTENYTDVFLHEIIGGKRSKNKKKGTMFPFTRWDNILNRPKVCNNVRYSNNPEFMLVQTDEEEIDNREIFNIFGQSW